MTFELSTWLALLAMAGRLSSEDVEKAKEAITMLASIVTPKKEETNVDASKKPDDKNKGLFS